MFTNSLDLKTFNKSRLVVLTEIVKQQNAASFTEL